MKAIRIHGRGGPDHPVYAEVPNPLLGRGPGGTEHREASAIPVLANPGHATLAWRRWLREGESPVGVRSASPTMLLSGEH
jgi:hypothetical protein